MERANTPEIYGVEDLRPLNPEDCWEARVQPLPILSQYEIDDHIWVIPSFEEDEYYKAAISACNGRIDIPEDMTTSKANVEIEGREYLISQYAKATHFLVRNSFALMRLFSRGDDYRAAYINGLSVGDFRLNEEGMYLAVELEMRDRNGDIGKMPEGHKHDKILVPEYYKPMLDS